MIQIADPATDRASIGDVRSQRIVNGNCLYFEAVQDASLVSPCFSWLVPNIDGWLTRIEFDNGFPPYSATCTLTITPQTGRSYTLAISATTGQTNNITDKTQFSGPVTISIDDMGAAGEVAKIQLFFHPRGQAGPVLNVADLVYVHPNHTGDVTSVGDGATTIANDAVTNAKLANVATATFKGRITAGTGDSEDLTAAQALTVLNAITHGQSLALAAGRARL